MQPNVKPMLLVAIALALEIEVGLGIRGFFSASVFALGTMEVVIQYHTGGAKLTLSVCGGVRIQVIFWRYEHIFAETSWSTQSSGYVERGAQNAIYSTKLKKFDAFNFICRSCPNYE